MQLPQLYFIMPKIANDDFYYTIRFIYVYFIWNFRNVKHPLYDIKSFFEGKELTLRKECEITGIG